MVLPLCFLLVTGAAPDEFRQVAQGAAVSLELGSNPAGIRIMADLGLASYGIKTLHEREWLLQWNGEVGARGGVLAKSFPIRPFVGANLESSGEIGRRFAPAHDWSGYLGVGAGLDLHVLASTDVRFSRLAVLGNLDDVGGLGTRGYLRAAGGVSFIRGRHSVVLAAFAQTQIGVPTLNDPVDFFGGGGLEARWDYRDVVTLYLDGFVGVSPVVANVALGSNQQKTHEQLTVGFRYFFPRHMWLGGRVDLGGDQAVTRYPGFGTAYRTSEIPSVALWVQYGIEFGG